MKNKKLKEKIIACIKQIYDPEIPIDIYQLGLIYDIDIDDEKGVVILMTLTTPNCPVAESLPEEVEEKVSGLKDVKKCQVKLTFDPPWTKDMMSEEAMLELGFI